MGCVEEYIGILLEKYGDMVFRVAYTYMRNQADAEDVAQDVFLKILEKMPDFNDETHEKSWIIRTTINICKNKLKLFWNRNTSPIEKAEGIFTVDKYDEEGVFGAVLNLPKKYRMVVYLYYYEGYTTPEIGRILGKGDATVRSMLHRARLLLKSELKGGEDIESLG